MLLVGNVFCKHKSNIKTKAALLNKMTTRYHEYILYDCSVYFNRCVATLCISRRRKKYVSYIHTTLWCGCAYCNIDLISIYRLSLYIFIFIFRIQRMICMALHNIRSRSLSHVSGMIKMIWVRCFIMLIRRKALTIHIYKWF